MEQQTAVQFLLAKIIQSNASKFGDVLLHGYLSGADIEKAKQTEKEQIMQAYNDGKAAVVNPESNQSLEQYYNKTYGK